MNKKITAVEIRAILKSKKEGLFRTYNLDNLAFAINTFKTTGGIATEGKNTIAREYIQLTVIVDFINPIGWDFYRLHSELIEYLGCVAQLVTRHEITKRKAIIENADIYEII